MTSKADILARIRKHGLTHAPLPSLEGDWITYPDAIAKFREVLEGIGGVVLEVQGNEAIAAAIREQPCMEGAEQIMCAVPDLGLGNVEMAGIDDPHALADVDVAILPGELAVAENGAVWVTNRHVPHRVIYFITQHLVLTVPRDRVLHNMHQAYDTLDFAANTPEFGVFISGPSKTADIEQSLVIGAHGARSTTVVLV